MVGSITKYMHNIIEYMLYVIFDKFDITTFVLCTITINGIHAKNDTDDTFNYITTCTPNRSFTSDFSELFNTVKNVIFFL